VAQLGLSACSSCLNDPALNASLYQGPGPSTPDLLLSQTRSRGLVGGQASSLLPCHRGNRDPHPVLHPTLGGRGKDPMFSSTSCPLTEGHPAPSERGPGPSPVAGLLAPPAGQDRWDWLCRRPLSSAAEAEGTQAGLRNGPPTSPASWVSSHPVPTKRLRLLPGPGQDTTNLCTSPGLDLIGKGGALGDTKCR
jgi:hypothetical protein